MRVAALHFVEQGDEDAGAAGADGMADGDGAAVDVDAVEGEAEFFGDAEGLDAEGFVEFEEVDVVDGPAGAGEDFLNAGDGSEHDPAGSDAAGGLRADGGERREVEFAGAFGGHEDDGGGCVVDAGRVAGGDGAIFLEGGLEGGERFERGVGADAFVVREDGGRRAFFGGEGEGNDFGVEAAGLLCGGGFAMGVERVLILLFAGDGVLVGDEFAGHAHVLVVAGAPEAVVDHGVDGFGVAHAKTLARIGQKVGRVGHGFHAASDGDLGVAESDGLSGEADGFEAGAADHVDGESGNGVGETAAKCSLARGILAEAGGKNAAHDALGDVGGIEAARSTAARTAMEPSSTAERWRECAEEFSDGGAGCTDDDNFTHGDLR